MNRRNILKVGLISVGTLALKPVVSRAEGEAGDSIVIFGEIANNHGHALVLDPAQALSLLRSSRDGAAAINIQGQSGHPHALEFSHEELLALFINGQIEKVSTVEFGHSHGVIVHMDITAG